MKGYKKVLRQGRLQELLHKVRVGEISTSRMIEIINDLAFFKYKVENTYQTLDDSEIKDQEIIEYMRRRTLWELKEHSSRMDEAMSEPDKPNCMFSNTH